MRTLLAMTTLFLVASVVRAEEFKPLFDGKVFEGWEGNLDHFRIEDGAIVGGSLKDKVPRNEFLCTKKEYADFELRLRVKVVGKGANAGVQIRSRRIPQHHEMIGYQADVAPAYWGALYDESRRRKFLVPTAKPEDLAKLVKKDGWNDYVIRCEGPRVRLWLNGELTVDYTEPDPAIPRNGRIALQVHSGNPTELHYKDILIEEL